MEPQMNADERRFKTNEVTERIIGAAYRVSNGLGCGFLEKIYENALAHELRKSRLRVDQQRGISVMYDGVVVGEYVADLLVEDQVIVETKACKSLDDVHAAQCLNYLKATGLKASLLLNFGTPKVQVKRIVHAFDDDREPWPKIITSLHAGLRQS